MVPRSPVPTRPLPVALRTGMWADGDGGCLRGPELEVDTRDPAPLVQLPAALAAAPARDGGLIKLNAGPPPRGAVTVTLRPPALLHPGQGSLARGTQPQPGVVRIACLTAETKPLAVPTSTSHTRSLLDGSYGYDQTAAVIL